MSNERWVDIDSTPEQDLFVSHIEHELQKQVDLGRIPEEKAQNLLQRAETFNENLVSNQQAEARAEVFRTEIILPAIYAYESILNRELELAELQGIVQLDRETLIERLGDDAKPYLKTLANTNKRIEALAKSLAEEKARFLN